MKIPTCITLRRVPDEFQCVARQIAEGLGEVLGGDNYAVPAYGHETDEPGAGSGGISTWIAPSIKHMVESSGQDRSGRALWVRLSGIPGGDVSILNVYAPNSPSERRILWDELASILPRDCRWVLGGDWNVVEFPEDKSNSAGNILAGAERVSFHQLLVGLEVNDPFDRSSPLK